MTFNKPSLVLRNAGNTGEYCANQNIDLFAGWKDLTRLLSLNEGQKYCGLRALARTEFVKGYKKALNNI